MELHEIWVNPVVWKQPSFQKLSVDGKLTFFALLALAEANYVENDAAKILATVPNLAGVDVSSAIVELTRTDFVALVDEGRRLYVGSEYISATKPEDADDE